MTALSKLTIEAYFYGAVNRRGKYSHDSLRIITTQVYWRELTSWWDQITGEAKYGGHVNVPSRKGLFHAWIRPEYADALKKRGTHTLICMLLKYCSAVDCCGGACQSCLRDHVSWMTKWPLQKTIFIIEKESFSPKVCWFDVAVNISFLRRPSGVSNESQLHAEFFHVLAIKKWFTKSRVLGLSNMELSTMVPHAERKEFTN